MLEQIHTPTEDQRTTKIIIALGLVAFGIYTLAGAAMGGWSALATVGLLIGSGGAAMLQRAVTRSAPAPVRLAH